MEDQSDWILNLLKVYKRSTNNNPVFISDWDVLNENAHYPKKFISQAYHTAPEQSLVYTFSDEQYAIKDLLIENFAKNRIIVGQQNIAITISATASLYLTLVSLFKKGVRRFLILTPAYYSIIHTLKDLNADVHLYNLADVNDFDISYELICRAIQENDIQCLIVCDPIYCVGKEISIEQYIMLKKISTLFNCWILIDNTLGGLEWNKKVEIFNYDKISQLVGIEKFIIIDSLTKRMLVNGLKHSIIISDPNLITEIEDFASQVYGGFCYPQLEMMKELYNPHNLLEITNMLNHNVSIIKANYSLLRSFLIGTKFQLYEASSGYFTMIVHEEYINSQVDIKAQITSYLYDYNTFTLPPFYFYFHESNHFGIRLNLLKEPSTYLPFLEQCIGEKVKLLH